MLEFWQGPSTPPAAAEGRPPELPKAFLSPRDALCGPALAADVDSAPLLWFCAKAATQDASRWLWRAAELVEANAHLWELAAAAHAIETLEALGGAAGVQGDGSTDVQGSGRWSRPLEALESLLAALRRAATLRTSALVPDPNARPPAGWDDDEVTRPSEA